MIPDLIVSAEKYFFSTLLPLFLLAAPTTRLTHNKTPAISDQHSDIFDFSIDVRRSFSRLVVLLGAGAAGGGKKVCSEDSEIVEEPEGRGAVVVEEKEDRAALIEENED